MTRYFLRSERLGFRRWSPRDLGLARELWGDPEVTRWIGGPFGEPWVKERLAREIETMKSAGVQYWPIFLLVTGEHAGVCGLRPYRPEEQIFALGFHLRPEHWGKGLAHEAARAVIDHAFSELGARALFAGHNPGNVPSRGLLGKLGFKYSHDELYPPTGLQHPSYFFTAEDSERAACAGPPRSSSAPPAPASGAGRAR